MLPPTRYHVNKRDLIIETGGSPGKNEYGIVSFTAVEAIKSGNVIQVLWLNKIAPEFKSIRYGKKKIYALDICEKAIRKNSDPVIKNKLKLILSVIKR